MIVADTNLVIPLLIEHELRENAIRLHQVDPDWHLPDWWLVELSNVLRNYHRAELFDSAQVLEIFANAQTLFPPENHHPADLPVALRIACECTISTYDACFIALAREMEKPLVTEDKALRKACPADTISLTDSLR